MTPAAAVILITVAASPQWVVVKLMGSAEPITIPFFMNIVRVSPDKLPAAIELLQKNNLPTADIDSNSHFFIVEESNNVIATAAVEYNCDTALLRSLSVDENFRNKGIGTGLIDFVEAYVLNQRVQTIYLLTATAEAFFVKRGYKTIDRSAVPSFIKNTTQYSVLCSSSSTLMKKQFA